MPPDEIGPLLPVSKEEVDIFNDILSDEIDFGFGSSICCCDFCYDDFKEHWPGVAFRDMTFQTQSMEAYWLVEYSRLPGIYSPAEISTLKRLVYCPRCLQYGAYNIWAYEHRFSDVEEIEQSIEELSALGAATPFLLLEHTFAKRVLNEIRALALTPTRTVLEKSLFRARLADSVESCGQEPDSLQTYAAPPASHAGEGRFNHAGAPMLYLASSAETAASELEAPGSTCHVAQLRLKVPLLVLDLVDIEEGDPGYELFSALANSALMAAPRTGEGWLKRQYVFSRFVGDCARSAGFDAIRYGSTKQLDGSNYVLLAPPQDLTSLAVLEARETFDVPAPSERW